MDSLATGNLAKVRKALSVVVNPTQSQFRYSLTQRCTSTPSSGEKQNFKACYMLRKPG